MNMTKITRRALVTALKEADAYLDGAKIHLYKDEITPNADSVLADFDDAECDFGGYTATGVSIGTWGAVGTGDGGRAQVSGAEIEFVPNTTVSQNAGGYYITNAASDELLFYQPFASPFPFLDPSTILRVVAMFQLPEDGESIDV